MWCEGLAALRRGQGNISLLHVRAVLALLLHVQAAVVSHNWAALLLHVGPVLLLHVWAVLVVLLHVQAAVVSHYWAQADHLAVGQAVVSCLHYFVIVPFLRLSRVCSELMVVVV